MRAEKQERFSRSCADGRPVMAVRAAIRSSHGSGHRRQGRHQGATRQARYAKMQQLEGGSLIPQAHGVIDAEMRAALDEREALIEARADAILDAALAESVPWTKALGSPRVDRRRAVTWRRAARVVAAYRDRYRITDDAPLGAPAESAAQKIDAARASAALRQAMDIATAPAVTRPQVRTEPQSRRL